MDPCDVRLQRGAGTPGRGGGLGGFYWRIFIGEESAGSVFINMIDEPPLGQHPSIQIAVNKTWQGRGVGRQAYLLASEQSGYDTVYAHMRKANIGSRKAAEHAGYQVIEHPEVRQLLMAWRRNG